VWKKHNASDAMRKVFRTIRRKDKHYFPNNVHCELFFMFFYLQR